MKTIDAKELRLHLDQVFDRVIRGEDIIVNHRFKGLIRLSAVHVVPGSKPEIIVGLRAFDAAIKRKSPYDPHKSIKELYDESISKRYTD